MTSLQTDFGSHFGIENIPFGIASSENHKLPQAVSRIKDNVIFLRDLVQYAPELHGLPDGIFSSTTLNAFAALGRPAHKLVRSVVQKLVEEGKLPDDCIEHVSDCEMHLPVLVADFTDFSCSEYHNLNAGLAALGRKGLPPSWGFIPPGMSSTVTSLSVRAHAV